MSDFFIPFDQSGGETLSNNFTLTGFSTKQTEYTNQFSDYTTSEYKHLDKDLGKVHKLSVPSSDIDSKTSEKKNHTSSTTLNVPYNSATTSYFKLVSDNSKYTSKSNESDTNSNIKSYSYKLSTSDIRSDDKSQSGISTNSNYNSGSSFNSKSSPIRSKVFDISSSDDESYEPVYSNPPSASSLIH